MGKIFVLPTFHATARIKNNYCWNENWVHEFESPWSLFEKFKYANTVKDRDVLEIFGTEEIKNKKVLRRTKNNSNLYSLSGFDNLRLAEVFGHDFKQTNEENIKNIINTLPRRTGQYLRDHLCICNECMKFGYHSILHQFKLIHNCPIHNEPLIQRCPGCDHTFNYELSDEHFASPFQCECGYEFLNTSFPFEQWNHNNLDIVNDDVQKWLHLIPEEKSILGDLILFEALDEEQYPDMLNNILSVILNEDESHNNHVILRSTKNILRYGNNLNKYLELESAINENHSLRNEKWYDRFQYKIHDEIYWSTVATIKGIASRLRKTVMKDHRQCIKDFRYKDEPYCPYAYAYVFWRKFSENYKTYWEIDNGYRPRRSTDNLFPKFCSDTDHEELLHIIESWNGGSHLRKYKHLAATKWIINKVVMHISLNHFRNWIRVADHETRLRSSSEIHNQLCMDTSYQPFQYNNLPFFLIKVPNEEKGEKVIEFHYWMNSKHTIQYERLICRNRPGAYGVYQQS